MAVFKDVQGDAGREGHLGSAEPSHYSVIDVSELARIPQPSVHLLQYLFQLTPAETRLAQAICGGDTLEQAAHNLGIKVSTARTQVAALFAKTQTRRQSQLIALLVRAAHLGS